MKNLFNYATKELSQDAFLRWLFESHTDDDVKPCVEFLLKHFCHLNETDIITDVQTRAQHYDIDIEVKFNVNGVKYALYIEDKTYSGLHKQLKKYNEAIEKKEHGVHATKIVYKTYLISESDEEEARINDWTAYDINDIYNIFLKCPSSSNLILQQYREHINKIYEAVNSTIKPTKHESKIDLVHWESYFHHIGDSLLEKYGYKNKYSGIWRAGQYPYMCLNFRKGEYTPYLEIRSKECINGKFQAVILCYGVGDEGGYSVEKIPQLQEPLIEAIKMDGMFKPASSGRAKKYQKQLGRYTAAHPVTTDEEFIAEIEKCIQYYEALMGLWNSNT